MVAMCFHLESQDQKPQIAEIDIECYKYTEHTFYCGKDAFESDVYRFSYERDKIHGPVNIELQSKYCKDNMLIEYGFHSNSEKPNAWYPGGCTQALFVIPKGSLYYHNFVDKEYVSNQIIFKRLLTENEINRSF